MPVTISRPRTPRISSTAATKAWPSPSWIAADSALDPAGLGFERAHRRCDQGAGALDLRRGGEGRGLAMDGVRGSRRAEGAESRGFGAASDQPQLRLNVPLTISVLASLTKAPGSHGPPRRAGRAALWISVERFDP